MPIGNTEDVIAAMPRTNPARRPSPIGLRIKHAREERQWKLTDLATRAGVPVSYVSKVESGAIQAPSAEYVGQIAAVLGWSSDDLLRGRPQTVDPTLADAVAQALGSNKAHLVEAAIEALRELPPAERDHAIDVLHTLATNWPKRQP